MDYRKLAIVGEVGAGKTQLISTISEISPLSTEAKSTVDIGKEYTTVGIDYGRLTLSPTDAIGLYGLPGQDRYAFLWDIVGKNIWGLLVLVKYDEQLNLDSLRVLINHFDPKSSKVPVLVGITHAEDASDEKIDAMEASIQETFNEMGLSPPVLKVDPRDKKSSASLLAFFDAISEKKK